MPENTYMFFQMLQKQQNNNIKKQGNKQQNEMYTEVVFLKDWL